MNKAQKIIIFPITIFLMMVTLACNVLRPECDIKKVWKIQDYEIIEKRCIGFAGPVYYPVYLYKGNKEIDYLNYKKDSCIVMFNNQDGKAIQFDLCTMKIIESN